MKNQLLSTCHSAWHSDRPAEIAYAADIKEKPVRCNRSASACGQVLRSMKLYGAEKDFEAALEWLNQWACSRSFGLGTRCIRLHAEYQSAVSADAQPKYEPSAFLQPVESRQLLCHKSFC